MSGTQPLAARKTLKECIRHFTPAWFAVIMGTGAISILFHGFPYATDSTTLRIFTFIFFFLNLFLFVLFTALSAARYLMFPDIWPLMIQHPVQSLYLGCFPMGATTLINVAVGLIYQDYGFGGKPFVYVLWGFWWLDIMISFLCAFAGVHVMFTRQEHALSRMTSVWLLPVVTLIVASSTGGVISPVLQHFSPRHALITLTLSAFMVSIGLALAFMILTIYLLRLIVYGLPPGASIVSVFIPLGPMGQGGYSILLIGSGFRSLLPLNHSKSPLLHDPMTGPTMNVVCACIAFILFALGTMWMVYALLGVQDVIRKTRVPFKIPFWGLIFPNGVYANLAVQLFRTFDSPFFRVWGSIYSAATLLLWTLVFLRTVSMVKNGEIFEAPCLEDIDMARAVKQMADAEGGGETLAASRSSSGDVSQCPPAR